MVFGTIHAVRGWIENETAYFSSVQPCSNQIVRMNCPDLIPKFLNCMNGTVSTVYAVPFKKTCM